MAACAAAFCNTTMRRLSRCRVVLSWIDRENYYMKIQAREKHNTLLLFGMPHDDMSSLISVCADTEHKPRPRQHSNASSKVKRWPDVSNEPELVPKSNRLTGLCASDLLHGLAACVHGISVSEVAERA